MSAYRIAVIPGDGIGKEVMPEGLRVLEAAGSRFELTCAWSQFPWDCSDFDRTGRIGLCSGDAVATQKNVGPTSEPLSGKRDFRPRPRTESMAVT